MQSENGNFSPLNPNPYSKSYHNTAKIRKAMCLCNEKNGIFRR